ncbi:MAG: hypothetical protein ACM3YF_00975, partial [Candidatus Zixiibacteriota bacterium]
MKKGSLLLKFAIIVSMLVALSIREDAVSIPITLVLLNYIDKQEKSLNLSNLLRTDFIFLLPSCAFLGWRILGALQESMGYEFTLNPAVWVQNGLYFVLNLCVPIRFIFDQVGYEAHELLRLRIMTVKHVHFLIPVSLLLLVAIGFLVLRLRNKVSGLVRIGCILGVIGFLPYFALLGNAPRFIYFTLVGGVIMITSFIFWLSRQFSNALCHLVTVFVGIIVVVINFVVVQERSQWWLKSAKMATTILQQTKVIADSLEPGDTMYVVNLPRRLNGAYVFHNGYPEAISLAVPGIVGRVRYLGDKNLNELKEFRRKKIYTFENGRLKELMYL